MKIYRVNVLGCRSRGSAAARAYHQHPRTEVVGLCDLIPERIRVLGNEIGVSAQFSDLDEMIDQTEPDIVAVPTGTEFHYDLCMRVLEHGVNFEVEKPMCVDLLQADALLEKSAEKGVKSAVHHQGRTGPAMKAVATAIGEGKIGNLRHIFASGKGYYGGYGLMNIGTHLLNAMMEVTGHCRRVNASALTGDHPVTPEDVICSPSGMGEILGENITATLEFQGNVTATLLQHRFPIVDSVAYGLEFCGTEGRIFWKQGGVWWMQEPHFHPGKREAQWEPLDQIIPDNYQPESSAKVEDFSFVEEYVRALDEGREHICCGGEGRHVMEIMMGIFESAAYGRTVSLPQVERDHPLLRWRKEAGLVKDPEEMPRAYYEWLAKEDERLGLC